MAKGQRFGADGILVAWSNGLEGADGLARYVRWDSCSKWYGWVK